MTTIGVIFSVSTKKIAINTLGFLVIAICTWSYVTNWVALVASIVLAVLNLSVKPILFLLTLPVTIVTFGCFSFVLNAMMLKYDILVFVGPGFTFAESIHYLSGERSVNDYQRFVEI